MKNFLLKFKWFIIGGLTVITLSGGVALANVSVPNAKIVGQVPTGLSTGNYTNGNLVAGTNITINTTTPGQITLSATGGSGVPSGSSTQIQFNANGLFGASSNFTFATSTNTQTITGTSTVSNGIIVGATSFGSPFVSGQTPLALQGNINNYIEANIYNASNGTSSSADFVATANNGSANNYFFDAGINGGSYTSLGGLSGGPDDAFLANSDNSLYIGTSSTTNASANLYLGAANKVTATSSSAGWTFLAPLTVASSTNQSVLQVLANDEVLLNQTASSTQSSTTLASTTPVFQLGPTSVVSPNALGTYIGINAPANFNASIFTGGNFIDAQVNGVDKFNVNGNGDILARGIILNGSANISAGFETNASTNASDLVWNVQGGNDGNGWFANNVLYAQQTTAASTASLAIGNDKGVTWNVTGNFIQQWLNVDPIYYGAGTTQSQLAASMLQVSGGFETSTTTLITGRWVGEEINPIFGTGAERYNSTSSVPFMTVLAVEPKINVAASSTVGYVGLLVNPNETSTSTSATNYVALFQANSTTLFSIDNKGNIGSGGTIPTVSAGSIIAGSTNTRGRIIPVAAATTDTITFANGGFGTTPYCVLQQESGTGITSTASSTPTTLVINSVSVIGGDSFTYFCWR